MGDFLRGSLVRLRPGLPDLRVLGAREGSRPALVSVAWFECGELRRAELPADLLELSPAVRAGDAPGERDDAGKAGPRP